MQSICSTHRLPEVLPPPVLQRGPVGHASNSATCFCASWGERGVLLQVVLHKMTEADWKKVMRGSRSWEVKEEQKESRWPIQPVSRRSYNIQRARSFLIMKLLCRAWLRRRAERATCTADQFLVSSLDTTQLHSASPCDSCYS